jgi:N-hydroxyarylamine O-acetyltransferase
MNTEKYLSRLQYVGSLDPTPEVLSRLQKAHLLSIPFENLDIHYVVPIDLDIDKFYSKIILTGRGGFCYELNSLFYELLSSLGFRVRRISARVFDKTRGYGQEYDHLAIVAEIDGTEYLTDVGFGEFAFAPLELRKGVAQNDERGVFVIDPHEKDSLLVSKTENGTFVPQYIFNTAARELPEFREMCHYHQTDPLSHFTQRYPISHKIYW